MCYIILSLKKKFFIGGRASTWIKKGLKLKEEVMWVSVYI